MIRTIRINRKKWLRGTGLSVQSFLWNSEEQKGCCLGHAIHQTWSRCTWADLDQLTTPECILEKEDVLGLMEEDECDPDWLSGDDGSEKRYVESDFTAEAMRINDSALITDRQREKQLTNLFKKNKIKLVFYN